MAELTQTLAEILTATFGPATAAAVMKEEDVKAHAQRSSPDGADGSSTSLPPTSPATAADAEVGPSDLPQGSPPDGADGSVATLPHWWKRNLDGTPRKRCQAPEVLKGVPHGETRQRETDLLVLKALHAGAETLVEVVATTGFVKVTCTRSLERLVLVNQVLQSKAPPTGKRGRPAFTYRPTTEVDVPVDAFGVTAALAAVGVTVSGAAPSMRQDPVSGDDRGIDETSVSGADLRSTFVPAPGKADAGASTDTGAEE